MDMQNPGAVDAGAVVDDTYVLRAQALLATRAELFIPAQARSVRLAGAGGPDAAPGPNGLGVPPERAAAHPAASARTRPPASQDGGLMRFLQDGCPVYTATDLCDYLACGHLVALKRRVAAGESIPTHDP